MFEYTSLYCVLKCSRELFIKQRLLFLIKAGGVVLKDIIVTIAGVVLVCLILLNIVYGNTDDKVQKQLKDIGLRMKNSLMENIP